MKNNKKGFTLAEMLIVVAIIAILVAIVTPVLTKNLEKAREATDAANIRSAISEVTANYLAGESTGLSKAVTLTQTDLSKWASLGGSASTTIGGVTVTLATGKTTCTISIDANGTVTAAMS